MTHYTLSAIMRLPVEGAAKGQEERLRERAKPNRGKGSPKGQGSPLMTERTLPLSDQPTQGGFQMDTKEIAQKREYQAVDVLRRANVGYCYAAARLGSQGLGHATLLTQGGTPANSIVLAAVQFAFESEELFTEWLTAHNDRMLAEIVASAREDMAEGAE